MNDSDCDWKTCLLIVCGGLWLTFMCSTIESGVDGRNYPRPDEGSNGYLNTAYNLEANRRSTGDSSVQ